MIQLTVLYGQPKDPATFDRYHEERHTLIAKELPGLKGYASRKPVLFTGEEPSPAYLIAELYFEDREALERALQSPEGQAAVSDVENFATGGGTLLVGDVRVYHSLYLESSKYNA